MTAVVETPVRDRRWLWLGLVLVPAVALDQITKYLADGALANRGSPVKIIDGFFMLYYSRNAGAFFSLGETLPDGIRIGFFVAATILAMGFIVHLYRRARSDQGMFRAALLLFLSGALGNLIDRVRQGEVVDFMHLHYEDTLHWATFNVADVYITVGLALLLVDAIRGSRPRVSAKKAVEQS